MIQGIGVDIVETDRIGRAVARFGNRFVMRILTPSEVQDVGSPPRLHSLAARYAAKEAVAKALGTGLRGFSWHDIEVRRTDLGEPYIQLYAGAQRRAEVRGIRKVWITLSHADHYAVATAVAEG